MTYPLAIANYFISKSLETGQEITLLKLVKLVYISHGWHLALTGEPLLAEGVQAWKYGPVVPSVYRKFKRYGNSAITALELDAATITYPIVEEEKLKTFLDKIWEVYGKFNGLQLSSMTHQPNTPWDIVWNKEGRNKREGAIIRNELIEKHYKEKANGETVRQQASAN